MARRHRPNTSIVLAAVHSLLNGGEGGHKRGDQTCRASGESGHKHGDPTCRASGESGHKRGDPTCRAVGAGIAQWLEHRTRD